MSLLFFTLLCRFDNKYTWPGPRAEDGLLTLTEENLGARPLLFLAGGWKFYRGYHAPEELKDLAPDRTLYARGIPPVLTRGQETPSMADYPVGYRLAIVALPLCGVLGLHGVFQWSLGSSQNTTPELLLAVIMIAAIDGFIFFLYNRLLAAKRSELHHRALEKEVEYYYNQFELAYDAQKQAETLRHDIKNKLTGLQGYLSTQSEEAKAYFQDMVDETNGTEMPACCGVLVVDAIINSKAAEAHQKGIRFDASLNLDESCFQIPPVLMSTILGNALDNAIEAAQEVSPGERYVKIGMTDSARTLMIVVKNSYNGLIRADGGSRFATLKKENGGHGLGLQSIRKAVGRLDGEVKIGYDSHEFSLSILLYPSEIKAL